MLLSIHNPVTDELVTVKGTPLLFNNEIAANYFILTLKGTHPKLTFEHIVYDVMHPLTNKNWDYFSHYEI